jgi:hypothetical protein
LANEVAVLIATFKITHRSAATGIDPIRESSCIASLFRMWERDDASLGETRVLSPLANV